jgi:hypothetical protein
MPKARKSRKNKQAEERQPKAGAKVKQRKRPIPGAGSSRDETIIWALNLVDLEGPWGWNKLGRDDFGALQGKFKSWESLRPGEFFGGGGKRGNKRIPLENLCSEAQRRLEHLQLDDLPGLWELHAAGQPRIWGHREEHVFYILWWDPDHTVCPSRKKR